MTNEVQLALSKLQGVKQIQGGWIARCPCHDDTHQSLSIADKGGKIMLFCHAGCSFDSIIKMLDLRPDRTSDSPVITATYDYTDSEGNLLYQVVRYHPKTFKHRRPDGHGNWIWNLQGITPTLYCLPEIIQAVKDEKLIWIVEGEKDVDNLRKAGQVATTISGGASNKWPPSLVPLFLNSKVAIIPDSDEPGRKYAQYLANLLYGIAGSVRVVGLPLKDVSDYLLEKPIDSLVNIYNNSPEYIPTGTVTREEFNELRGLSIYLIRLLLRKNCASKRKSKYD